MFVEQEKAIEKSINSMLDKMPTKEVNLKIIHQAVGGINESEHLTCQCSKWHGSRLQRQTR